MSIESSERVESRDSYPASHAHSFLELLPFLCASLTAGVVFSEIYQVTGPVERFAGNIASEGYVVALPSSFHEFEGPEPIPYDTEGTDRGNKYKAGYIPFSSLTRRSRRPSRPTTR